MRSNWIGLVAFGALSILTPFGATAGETVAVVVDGPLGVPAEKALADLEAALKARGNVTVRREALGGEASTFVVVGTADSSKTVDRLLAAQKTRLPEQPESLCIRWLRENGREVLLIAGRDVRGLSYALLEAARAIEFSSADDNPLSAVDETTEAPYLRVRSITIHPFNSDLDAAWYFDERFWRGYFAMLALNRYNNFTLTFSDQTNYLNPIYAYLVEAPDYPQVRVKGLSPRDRERNLAMLRRIAELARQRGIDFTLGIWMQAPVPQYAGEVRVENLPAGLKAADYCAQGLRRVLEACPAIGGVQLRMNAEAGVPEDQQTEFYRPLFRAVAECGHPVRLDLRFKGLQPETTKAAIDAGLDLTVSTKFWCEHFGLPYHPTIADEHYRESRYSYGAMLSYPRDYRVVYRLWTVGSQRLLLWGDPEYAARFAHSCRLGGGEGFEVFAPLSNQGYGDAPGRWEIFADPSYKVGDWDYQRYWFFYLAFGRLGYNPATSPQVWRWELRQRFGEAAGDVESAYRSASRIMPLITAARMPSASEWRWWPEMETGGPLREYIRTPPSDTAQFYAIRSWEKTPAWYWDDWDATIPGYAEDAAAGKLGGKTTPFEVSRRLLALAKQVEAALDRAKTKACDPQSPEFRGTILDLQVLAELARFHAEKTQAAAHLALFETTGEAGRLPVALEHIRTAESAWSRICGLTDGVYHDDLVFGIAKGSARSRGGQHHSGHWKDRLAEVQADVAEVQRLLAQHGGEGQKFRTFPGEEAAGAAIRITPTPVAVPKPGEDLRIDVQVKCDAPLREVLLHYRPLDQTKDWRQLSMQPQGDNCYSGVIPSKEIPPDRDFQYYLETIFESGGGRLWPSWEEGQPYVVVPVDHSAVVRESLPND